MDPTLPATVATGIFTLMSSKPVIQHILKEVGLWTNAAQRQAKADAEAQEIKDRAKLKVDQELLPERAQIQLQQAQVDHLSKAIAESGMASLPAVSLRALERNLVLDTERQIRIESILQKVAPKLEEAADPSNISGDFVRNVITKCQDVEDSDMQELWAKILAGEANKKGSFSKKSVEVAASLDKTDAELFNTICAFQFRSIDNTPFLLIYDYSDLFYARRGINFEALKHLEQLGLIHFSDDPLFYQGFNGLSPYLDFFGRKTIILMPSNQLVIGKVLLTRIGRELIGLTQNSYSEEVEKYIEAKFASLNISIISKF